MFFCTDMADAPWIIVAHVIGTDTHLIGKTMHPDLKRGPAAEPNGAGAAPFDDQLRE